MSPTDVRPGGAAPAVVSAAEPLLCVSIHDVAPATWADCARLRDALRAVAPVPLTWLVVPRFHGSDARSPQMEAQLNAALAGGDELALHGYTHLDDKPVRGGLSSRFLRAVYTQREGEFAALQENEARRRIELGLAWFAAHGWPVAGFVPPAWLLGEGAWRALRSFPFEYTTTFSRFHLLPPAPRASRPAGPLAGPSADSPAGLFPGPVAGPSLFSPSLVYTARNGAGRLLSPPACDAMRVLLGRAPLVRLSLHPRDAHYPALVRHAQHLLGRLLEGRVAVTKLGCARRLTSTDPTCRRASADRSTDSWNSAAGRPWC